MTKFDEHLASKDFGGSTDADIDIARAAWNAGIEAAKIEVFEVLETLEDAMAYKITVPEDLDYLLEGER